MASVVVLGAGMTGLTAAVLLARAGHRVTVLERDAAPPPLPVDAIWSRWERPGVAQFRQVHIALPRWTAIMGAEIPDAIDVLADMGGRRVSMLHHHPEQVTCGWWPGDERFDTWTARRPVLEASLDVAASATDSLIVCRGARVAGLLIEQHRSGVPHVVGVGLDGGHEIRADVVVDAGGRHSPVVRWLRESGHRAPVVHATESGSMYYTRHFRGRSDRLPRATGSLLRHYPSLSTLTLPADNRTWAVGLVAHGKDRAMRALRHAEVWEAVARRLPSTADWLDAEPLGNVHAFAGQEDRITDFVVDGRPVVTGLLPVGDSWARTNPGLGRGLSLGALHSVAVRDTLAETGADDPHDLAVRFAERSETVVRPLVDATVDFGRNRLADMAAERDAAPYPELGPAWMMSTALAAGARSDAVLARALSTIGSLLASPAEVFVDPDLVQRTRNFVGAPRYPDDAPSRTELLDVIRRATAGTGALAS